MNLESLEPLDLLEYPVVQLPLVHLVHPEPLDLLELLDLLEPLDLLESLEPLDLLEPLEHLSHPEHL